MGAELKKTCELNKAMCALKLNQYAEARQACSAVLHHDKQNVKALYRLAQAEHGLENFAEAIGICKMTIELDPQNRDARALLKQAQEEHKKKTNKEKGFFSNMAKGFGQGPIPAPGRGKVHYTDFDELDAEQREERRKQREIKRQAKEERERGGSG